VIDTRFEVMLLDTAGELNLLDLHDHLLFLRFLFSLIALESELSVINCATYGGRGIGHDQY
jgi:hypothetical protein